MSNKAWFLILGISNPGPSPGSIELKNYRAVEPGSINANVPKLRKLLQSYNTRGSVRGPFKYCVNRHIYEKHWKQLFKCNGFIAISTFYVYLISMFNKYLCHHLEVMRLYWTLHGSRHKYHVQFLHLVVRTLSLLIYIYSLHGSCGWFVWPMP